MGRTLAKRDGLGESEMLDERGQPYEVQAGERLVLGEAVVLNAREHVAELLPSEPALDRIDLRDGCEYPQLGGRHPL